MDWEVFKEKIALLLSSQQDNINLKIFNDKIRFKLGRKTISFEKTEFIELMNEASNYKFDKYSVSNDMFYEVPIAINSKKFNYNFIRQKNLIESIELRNYFDDDVYIDITEVSHFMLLNILNNIDFKKCDRLNLGYLVYLGDIDTDIFGLLKAIFRIDKSLLLWHKKDIAKNRIEQFLKSYLFNISYESKVSYKILNNDGAITKRANYIIKSNKVSTEIAPRNKLYKVPALDKYQMALSSDNPVVQFLGYYNVLEYFSGEVQLEKLVKLIKIKLSDKNFSLYDNKDIVAIINTVKNNNQESIRGKEQDYIELTLKNYVIINNLVKRLKSNELYMNGSNQINKVEFSDGVKVDFTKDKETVFKSLASRIYRTRNAIVHSKSNDYQSKERKIYNYFDNEQELLDEIPLMKAIAEEIIINTAEDL